MVLRLYQEIYFDLKIRHFHEKLGEEHQIEVSYTWVKALQGDAHGPAEAESYMWSRDVRKLSYAAGEALMGVPIRRDGSPALPEGCSTGGTIS